MVRRRSLLTQHLTLHSRFGEFRAFAVWILTSFFPDSVVGRGIARVSRWPGNQVSDISRADTMQTTSHSRSKTGCRTCRIRKVKCDEQKQTLPDQEEPQCNKCVAARIRCEWKGGPIPRKPPASSSSRTRRSQKKLHPRQSIPAGSHCENIQAANSLVLSASDRDYLNYLQSSTLVVLLGKRWPWSVISYAYHKIATKEPMVMSMMLASTAREIHRSQLHDQETQFITPSNNFHSELDGQTHYGRALASLRDALKQDVTSPAKTEAIFITLCLMIDYENRFGSGPSAINIHIRGIKTMLLDHIVPLLLGGVSETCSSEITIPEKQSAPSKTETPSPENHSTDTDNSSLNPDRQLYNTSVPLFFLITLYFFTPTAPFFDPETTRLDTEMFQFFLGADNNNHEPRFTLPQLYHISRRSPSRFWGDGYSLSAQLDDVENLPALTLYHRSHVIQFKITQLYNCGPTGVSPGKQFHSLYQWIMNEFHMVFLEYDSVLASVRQASSDDIACDGRRLMETNFWAVISFYSAIVYFHLCLQTIPKDNSIAEVDNDIPALNVAVSQVLELSLKLHRNRPHLVLRLTWPLFVAGIATSDQIYQDWVSIRLRELGRYGQNYSQISQRFDEMLRGSHSYFGNEGHFLAGYR